MSAKTSIAVRPGSLAFAPANKLRMPTPDGNWLPRPALIARLNHASDRRLTLISAPLGFGKTTLAIHWLAKIDRPVVWITLDRGDDRLIDFARLIACGVQSVLPEACATTLNLVENASSPKDPLVIETLLADLCAITMPLMLVLDNCETLSDAGIHLLMREWLARAPAALHLVVLTRIDPPWQLAKLRLKDQVCDIRGSDLHFTRAETSTFISRDLRQPLDDQTVNWLVEYTEGWPAVLQLARLALHNQSPTDLRKSFRGTNQQITEYLAEEVLHGLPQSMRRFLLAAAVPEQFCAALMAHLLAQEMPAHDANAIITALENAGLFIRPVDADRIWFRLHPLFRDFLLFHLRVEQGATALKQIHLRAGAWFEQNNLAEPAIAHALAAGEVNRAAGIVLSQFKSVKGYATPSSINQSTRFLALFSEADLSSHVVLLFMQAFIAHARGNYTESIRLADEVHARLADPVRATDAYLRSIVIGALKSIESERLVWMGDGAGALAAADEALALLPPEHALQIAAAKLWRLVALCQVGRKTDAIAFAQMFHLEGLGASDERIYMAYLGTLIMHIMSGDLRALDNVAREAQQHYEARGGGQNWRAFQLYAQAIAQFERNDLAGAATCFAQLIEMRYAGNVRVVHDAMLMRALLAQFANDSESALALAQEARQYAGATQNSTSLALSTSLEARLALMQSRLPESLDMLAGVKPIPGDFVIWFERPRLTKAEVLMALGGKGNLIEALAFTEIAMADARRMNNMRMLIYGLVTYSAVLQQMGDTARALAAFNEALALGRQTGYVRPFIALGKPVEAMLQRDDLLPGLTGFANTLRHAMAGASTERSRELGLTTLTAREMDVVKLLAERQSVTEMAERLCVSTNTVKKHLANIYSKLNVKSGRQAVAVMREADLLPPA